MVGLRSKASLSHPTLLTQEEVLKEYLFRQTELDSKIKTAKKALKKLARELRNTDAYLDRHITGFMVRFRTKFGYAVSPLTPVICINVAQKYTPSQLRSLGIPEIPRLFKKVSIKVLEGEFETLSVREGRFLRGSVLASPIDFGKPLVGGVPISKNQQASKYGTLGMLFQEIGQEPVGFTCQHVAGGVTQSIDQIGPSSTTRDIGAVESSVLGDCDHLGVIETLDCAAIRFPNQPGLIFPVQPGAWIRGINIGPEEHIPLKMYFSSTRVGVAEMNRPVFKFGAASGVLTQGRISDDDLAEGVIVGDKDFRHNFSIDGDESFVQDGDSGSVIAIKKRVAGEIAFVAIGILFARLSNGFKTGIACNMSHVIQKLAGVIPNEWMHPR